MSEQSLDYSNHMPKWRGELGMLTPVMSLTANAQPMGKLLRLRRI